MFLDGKVPPNPATEDRRLIALEKVSEFSGGSLKPCKEFIGDILGQLLNQNPNERPSRVRLLLDCEETPDLLL
jgi:hypothetical protein